MKYQHSETGKVIDVMDGTKLASVYVPVTDSKSIEKSKPAATEADDAVSNGSIDLTAAKATADAPKVESKASAKAAVKKAAAKPSK